MSIHRRTLPGLDDVLPVLARFMRTPVSFRAPAAPFDSPEVFRTLGLTDDAFVVPALDPPTTARRHEEISFTFPSRVKTQWPECDTVHGHLYLLPGRPRAPICVLVHGNGASSPVLERRRAAQLLRSGVHAARFEWAHHMHRIPSGDKRATRSLSPDLHACVQTFVQAASDGADLVRWLRTQPFVYSVGMAGWSGGGLTTMLAMTLTELDFALPVVPAVDISVPLSSNYFPHNGRDLIRDNTKDFVELQDLVRAVVVKEHRPLGDPRLLIIAGGRDEVCGTAATRECWESWGQPPIVWTRYGHLAGALRGVKARLLAMAWG